MIKRLYKRIRLYFINRHIYKIHNKTLDIKDRINWIREHMFDKDIIQVRRFILMDKLIFTRMSNEINGRINNELRDKIIDNMKLDDVPNIDIIIEYIKQLDFESLINMCKVADILDWQLVGRIIGVVGETYKDKEV